jgi:hypothetical protein
MQTQIRFYITQKDDTEQPVVRTIPVTSHPVPRVQALAGGRTLPQQTDGDPTTERAVARLVRRAVRRSESVK